MRRTARFVPPYDDLEQMLSRLLGQPPHAHVVAHFSRRGEEEIVVNPDDVEVLDSVTLSDDNAVEFGSEGEASDASGRPRLRAFAIRLGPRDRESMGRCFWRKAGALTVAKCHEAYR